eukprot:m.188543 g.188543  ORF g.188543 m.188543 type:complete len:319 (+) comp18190_c0_seq2:3125-4081(+)
MVSILSSLKICIVLRRPSTNRDCFSSDTRSKAADTLWSATPLMTSDPSSVGDLSLTTTAPISTLIPSSTASTKPYLDEPCPDLPSSLPSLEDDFSAGAAACSASDCSSTTTSITSSVTRIGFRRSLVHSMAMFRFAHVALTSVTPGGKSSSSIIASSLSSKVFAPPWPRKKDKEKVSALMSLNSGESVLASWLRISPERLMAVYLCSNSTRVGHSDYAVLSWVTHKQSLRRFRLCSCTTLSFHSRLTPDSLQKSLSGQSITHRLPHKASALRLTRDQLDDSDGAVSDTQTVALQLTPRSLRVRLRHCSPVAHAISINH